MISDFKSLIAYGLLSSISQLPVLLKKYFGLLVYFVLYSSLAFAIIFLSSVFDLERNIELAIQAAALLYIFFLVLKINGAMGIVLAEVVNPSVKISTAWQAWSKGFPYFVNALRCGVILFFGQMLLVCPCFLFLDNFVFSPFLFVYEALRGKEAENRSKELAKGFGWTVLNRTILLLFVGYMLLFGSGLILFTQYYVLGIVLITLLIFYLSLVQSNIIYKTYSELLVLGESERKEEPAGRYKVMTLVFLMGLVIFYLIIKIVVPAFVK